jgi:DoxX-like family
MLLKIAFPEDSAIQRYSAIYLKAKVLQLCGIKSFLITFFSMKKDKIIYWATTGIIGAMMLMSTFMHFTNPEVAAQFRQIGFQDWFRIELGAAKFLGAVTLLIPAVPMRFKTWAYVGFGITFISAALMHFSNGDGIAKVAVPLVLLSILGVSSHYLDKK